ncbi:MAG: hypothetical protein H6R14_422 [Proteobacteria bacterium]|nr:hypothetical protein [Pseudomonadota bacterium]
MNTISKRKLATHGMIPVCLSAFFLACGPAHAGFADTNTTVYLTADEYSGGVLHTEHDSVIPGSIAQTFGAPSVTSGNLFNWSATNVGAHSAFAMTEPSMQTLRSSVAVSSSGGTEYNAILKSAYNGHLITVGAGTSGLNAGDPITLNFTLHLDGTMVVGNSHYPVGVGHIFPNTYGYAAATSATMDYKVFADGQDTPTVAFHYQGDATYGYYTEPAYDVRTDTYSSFGRYSTDGASTWTDLASNESYDKTISPVPLVEVPGSPSSMRIHTINTGPIVLSMDSHVGDTLMLMGSLVTEARANGFLRMTALSDFGSTFDAEVTSSTPGIQILGLQAGIAPVPEASTYAMFLAGLGLIGFVARRRRTDN